MNVEVFSADMCMATKAKVMSDEKNYNNYLNVGIDI